MFLFIANTEKGFVNIIIDRSYIFVFCVFKFYRFLSSKPHSDTTGSSIERSTAEAHSSTLPTHETYPGQTITVIYLWNARWLQQIDAPVCCVAPEMLWISKFVSDLSGFTCLLASTSNKAQYQLDDELKEAEINANYLNLMNQYVFQHQISSLLHSFQHLIK